MDVLDKHKMQGFYLVMDNAPIHTPSVVQAEIERRGYKVMYLPPYSPFLNPIEEFWSKVKAGIKQDSLMSGESLLERIKASVLKVKRSDCQGWIRHSETFFEACKNQVAIL